MSRVLGLDVGDKRIGVALSDEGRLIASPLTVIQSVGWGPDSREILRLMEEHGAELIVCGLPRNMDGSVGFQAEKVQRFMQVLIDQGVPVAWMDERLTTVSAQRALIEGGVRREDPETGVVTYTPAPLTLNYKEMVALVKDGVLPLESALQLVTANPARNLSLKEKGRIAVGRDADFVALNEDLSIHSVYAKGKKVYEA